MPSLHPLPPRQNDSQELERFKEEIPLVPLATSRYGYDVTDQARNGSWHKLKRGPEVLIVSKKDGHEVYINTGDTKDSGSVVDFVKSRNNLNLGQTRQHLRAYLGENGPAADQQAYAAKPAVTRTERQAVRGAEANLPADPAARREELLRRTLGIAPALTDRTYLKERGLTDETIDAPAFAKRVFTSVNGPHKNTVFPLLNENGYSSYEEKNHNFKSVMPGVKDGIWVSQATGGRDRPLERLAIGESPIDQMSKYQLEQPDGKGPNTVYVATSGNMSQRQVELIQKVIDRRQPAQIVLANDNDPAGARYNLNYLNDLRAPRTTAAPGVEPDELARPTISWHATRGGDYHTDLKVTVEHQKAFQGRQAVAGLQDKVQTWQQEGGEQSAQLNVLRTGSEQTVVRLTVTNDQLPSLTALAQELRAQREATLPEAQRAPANFIVIERPEQKDYNLDLTEKIKQTQLAAARERAGFGNEPSGKVESVRKVEPVQPVELSQPATSRQNEAIGSHLVERRLTFEIRELGQSERGSGAAGLIENDLRRAGLSITNSDQRLLDAATGERHTRLEALYLTTQPLAERAAISRAVDIISQANGVTVHEPAAEALTRRAAAQLPTVQAQAEATPDQQLAQARQTFTQASSDLSRALANNGFELAGQRVQEVTQLVTQHEEALPLRGAAREHLRGALATAERIPALQENGQPGPIVQSFRAAATDLEEKHRVVTELGGPGRQRAVIHVVDERQHQENRAVPLWKDLKQAGALVGDIEKRAVTPDLVQHSFPVLYASTPGPELTRLNQLLATAERVPGINVEEHPVSRDVRQQLAGAPMPTTPQHTYQPGPAAATGWATYAVTSAHAPGSPQLHAQLAALRESGATVNSVEGQPRDSPQQLVSFPVRDERLGAISEAIKHMAQDGGNVYEVNRRRDLGELGGWNAATIRLTEAQDAARRTPQILDDLRANGVLVTEPQPLAAPSGFVREQLRIAYHIEQNISGVSAVLDALQRSPGIAIEESPAQQRSRELLALAEQQRREQEQRTQLAEAERLASAPEARRREQADRLLGAAILTLAVAEQGYPAENWKVQALRPQHDNGLPDLAAALTAAGAQVGGTRPEKPGRRELLLSYHPALVTESEVREVIERWQPTRTAAVPTQGISTPHEAASRAALGEQLLFAPPRQPQIQPQNHLQIQSPLQPEVEPGPWRTVSLRITEQEQAGRELQRAAELRARLSGAGAEVGPLSPAREAGPGLTYQYFTASYRENAPAQPAVARVLESAGRQPGVLLDEPLPQQQRRQLLLASTEAERGGPAAGEWQQGVIRVAGTDLAATNARTAAIRGDLMHQWASIGSGKQELASTGVVNEIHYSYHPQQRHLEGLNNVLTKAEASPGVEVREQHPQRSTPELEKRAGQFNQAVITIAEAPGAPNGKERAAALTADLSRAGAIVGEAQSVNGRVEVPVSYHTHAAGIQQINESLDKAANSTGISVQESGEDRGARLRGAQEVAAGQTIARPVARDQEREVER